MIERHFVLSLLFKEMGKDLSDLEQFQGRKYFQKIVYFAQMEKFGLDMGFGFSLHPHGPYSKELSECAKLIRAQGKECEAFAKTHDFRRNAQQSIERLKDFAATAVGKVSGVAFLEAAATLHFLWAGPFKHLPAKERKGKALETCHQLKPHFDQDTCVAIFAVLERWKLITE